MKNYYDTQKELELIKLRLDALHTQKESLKSLVEPKSVVTDKIMIDSNVVSPDTSMVTYLYLISEIEKESKEKFDRQYYLESKLQSMEEILRGIKDIKYRIFVMRYLDNLTVRQIARKLQYSRERIYQLLTEIDSTLGLSKDYTKLHK